MVIIAPEGHPLTESPLVRLQDLEDYPVIGYDRTSGLGKYTNRLYEIYGMKPNIICESPDEYAISDRNVEIIKVKDQEMAHTVYMGYLKNHYMIPAVKNFIKFIQKEGTRL